MGSSLEPGTWRGPSRSAGCCFARCSSRCPSTSPPCPRPKFVFRTLPHNFSPKSFVDSRIVKILIRWSKPLHPMSRGPPLPSAVAVRFRRWVIFRRRRRTSRSRSRSKLSSSSSSSTSKTERNSRMDLGRLGSTAPNTTSPNTEVPLLEIARATYPTMYYSTSPLVYL